MKYNRYNFLRNTIWLQKVNLLAFCCLLLVDHSSCLGQDVRFSQYFASPLLLNPSLTGSFDGQARVLSNYKNQWSSVTANPFVTFSTAADFSFLNDKLALGALVLSDKAGDSQLGTSEVSLSLATKVSLDNLNQLRFGLMGSTVQRSVSYAQLVWDNQFNGTTFDTGLDSGEPNAGNSFNYFDVSSGVSWAYDDRQLLKLNAGLAAFHLTSPRQSFYIDDHTNLPTKYVFHGGGEIGLKNSNTSLMPTFMLQHQQPSFEANVGMAVKYNFGFKSQYTGLLTTSSVYLGTYYRSMSDLVFYAGFDYHESLFVGLSYDTNLSGPSIASNGRGGAEISLGYIFSGKNRKIEVVR